MYPVATGEYGTEPFGSNGVIRVPSMNFIEDSPLKSHALYRVCLPLFQVKACPSPERATLPAFLEHVTVPDFVTLRYSLGLILWHRLYRTLSLRTLSTCNLLRQSCCRSQPCVSIVYNSSYAIHSMDTFAWIWLIFNLVLILFKLLENIFEEDSGNL